MLCTTECWSCEDKSCEHYVSKEKLYFENEHLKNNWNKLKEWLDKYIEDSYGLGSYETGISDALNDVNKKMQEIERVGEENG